MPKKPKNDPKDQQIAELTADLQRVRADFENYRKRVDEEKARAHQAGADKTVLDLLPVIDNIDRAIANVPEDIKDSSWVQGVAGLVKQLDKTLEKINIQRIEAAPGTPFNPDFHQAIQFDEDSQGETEVIDEQLQAGYSRDGRPIRHAMVKVVRK
ncbi:nucleotide exchange factor GrpE [Candidatus Saccharibacteria bacterium]|nr:MAG: nucleotide exchange factor GrpE [Candidatus Saccharibacteria bacterium]